MEVPQDFRCCENLFHGDPAVDFLGRFMRDMTTVLAKLVRELKKAQYNSGKAWILGWFLPISGTAARISFLLLWDVYTTFFASAHVDTLR